MGNPGVFNIHGSNAHSINSKITVKIQETDIRVTKYTVQLPFGNGSHIINLLWVQVLAAVYTKGTTTD